MTREGLRPDQVPHVKLFLFLYWVMTGLHALHVTIGIGAVLVVLFFMHALHSAAQTRAVILVTVFWLVVVFLGLTFSDYFTRGLINLPGH